MKSYSFTLIVGHVGRDPRVGETNGGRKVVNFDVATKRSWKDSSDQWQERVEWHKCNAWATVAEHASKLRSGEPVMVVGVYETKKWKTREGVERETKEIMASLVMSLTQRQRDDTPTPDAGYGFDADDPQV
jgi:single-strand DNA-binding protein